MNCDKTKVILQEKNFYNILYIIVPTEDLIPYLFTRLKGVLNKYLVNKKNVYEVNFKRIEDGNKEKVKISIKFYKFNIAEFKAKSEKDKIVTALKLMGFDDNDILYVNKVNKFTPWFVGVKLKEKFDDEEDQIKCEVDLEKQLENLLKFDISFQFDSDS